jgi:hypothetical protein
MTPGTADVLAEVDSFVGKRVSVYTRLFATFDEANLADSREALAGGVRLPICNSAIIIKRLLSTLEPYGGGRFIYDEPVLATGIVQQTEARICVIELEECKIQREDQTVSISFPQTG